MPRWRTRAKRGNLPNPDCYAALSLATAGAPRNDNLPNPDCYAALSLATAGPPRNDKLPSVDALALPTFLFLTIGFLIALAAQPLAGQEALLVEDAVASQTTVHPLIRVAGTLEPVWQAALAGTQGGRLLEIRGDVGDALASGAVAWTLDDSDLRLTLEIAKAAEQVAARQLEELRSGVRGEEIERLLAVKGEAWFFLSQIQAEKSRLAKLFQTS